MKRPSAKALTKRAGGDICWHCRARDLKRLKSIIKLAAVKVRHLPSVQRLSADPSLRPLAKCVVLCVITSDRIPHEHIAKSLNKDPVDSHSLITKRLAADGQFYVSVLFYDCCHVHHLQKS